MRGYPRWLRADWFSSPAGGDLRALPGPARKTTSHPDRVPFHLHRVQAHRRASGFLHLLRLHYALREELHCSSENASISCWRRGNQWGRVSEMLEVWFSNCDRRLHVLQLITLVCAVFMIDGCSHGKTQATPVANPKYLRVFGLSPK